MSMLHLIRRLVRQPLLTLSLLIGIALAVALAVAVPLATASLANLGLRATLQALPTAAQNIQLTRTNQRFDAGFRGRLTGQLGDIVAGEYSTAYVPLLGAAFPAGQGPVRLRVQERIFDYVKFDQGRLPKPGTNASRAPRGARPCETGVPLEVALSAEQATRQGLKLDDVVCVAGRSPLRIAGLWTPINAADAYWQGDTRPIKGETLSGGDQAGTPVAVLLLRDEDFPAVANFLGPQFDRAGVVYSLRIAVRTEAITVDTLTSVSDRLQTFRNQINGLQPRPTVLTGLDRAILTFNNRYQLLQSALLVLVVEVATLALLYVLIIGTLATEQQGAELAVLRSRGGSGRQLLGGQAGQAVVLMLPGLLLGLALGIFGVLALSRTALFQRLRGGDDFALRWTPAIGGLVGGVLLFALLALLWAARPALAQSLVSFRQERARPPTGNKRWQWDALLVILAGIGYWQLRRYGGALTTTLEGTPRFNLLVLAAPALMLVAGALVFLRLFPFAVRGLGRLLSQRPGVVSALSAWQLGRNPVIYGRLVLLLTLTVGLGVYTQIVSGAVTREQQRQAIDQAGADMRLPLTGNADALIAQYNPSASALLTRIDTDVLVTERGTERKAGAATLAGVDGAALALVLEQSGSQDTALLRTLRALSSSGEPPLGIALPAGSTEIEVELRSPGARGFGVFIKVAGLNDSRLLPVPLPTNEWQVMRAAIPADLAPPLAVQALIIQPNGDELGRTDQGVYVDNWAARIGEKRQPLNDFAEIAQWEALGSFNGVNLSPARDPDHGLHARITFGTVGGNNWAVLRYIVPMNLAIYSTASAAGIRVSGGQSVALRIDEQRITGQVQSLLTALPGLDTDRQNAFIADRGRLATLLTYGLPTTLPPNELRLALRPGARPPAQSEGSTKEAALLAQAADPLSNGVQVVLLLGFACAAVLSVLGFLTYAALTIRARAVDWAVLRAIGLGPGQLLGLVAAEQGFVLGGGVLGGAVVGLALATTTRPFIQVVTSSATPAATPIAWGGLWAVVGGIALALVLALLALLATVQRRGLLRTLRLGEG